MQAYICDPSQPNGLRFGEAAEPEPSPSEALVEVQAVSLNSAEVTALGRMYKPGQVPGWDAAGVVVRAARDGSGPKEGARVSTFGWGGAWARRRAVDTREIGVAPDGVDVAAASALPVAGVTALRAVRGRGALLGRRVLVTGAAGGVGRYAVQLAHLAGAQVVASVGSPARQAGLRELGADRVVVGLAGVEDLVDGVIDTVGGQTLVDAMQRLDSGGLLLSVGVASQEASPIDFQQQRLPNGRRAGGRRVEVFGVGSGFGPDITYLLDLVAKHRFDPCVAWRGPWDRIADGADALRSRQVDGKAVLELG